MKQHASDEELRTISDRLADTRAALNDSSIQLKILSSVYCLGIAFFSSALPSVTKKIR